MQNNLRKIAVIVLGVLICGGAFAGASYSEEQKINLNEGFYFADYMEMRGKLMIDLSKKLKKIKIKHREEINKGEYENYLDNLTEFLQGYKEARQVDPVEDLLHKIKSLKFDLHYGDINNKDQGKGDGDAN